MKRRLKSTNRVQTKAPDTKTLILPDISAPSRKCLATFELISSPVNKYN